MIRLFGTTISETVNAFRGPHLGEPQPDDKIKAIGRIVVSVLLVGVSVYLVRLDDTSQKAGLSLLSLVAGYWLK